ncbi:MAG: hypothetical protein M1834_003081 [Cirrosporium novae-zelandiae]|nr:MAG: hypothetical protein M1834_003081 [Cirrosporium novae-zelandiae]
MPWLTPKWYQFLISVFASLGSFMYGYDLGVVAEVVASESFISKFTLDSVESGLVVSMFTTGAFFGALGAGPTSEHLGRRWTIVIGCIVFLMGGGLQTGARTLAYLYAGRFFAGFGVGYLTMIVPLYQSELAHPSIRGRVTALQQFMLGIGSLCASWISYGTYVGFAPTNNAQWRVSLGLQMVPAVFLGLLIFLFPESPRWLLDHNKPEEGLKVLAKLHAHGDVDDVFVRAQYDQIQDEITHEHEYAAKTWSELFTNKPCFRRIILTTSIQASIQMTGVSAIQYYSVTIYGQMGINGADTLKYQAFNNIIAIFAQICCMLTIDHTGRRWTFIVGNLWNCVFFISATIILAKFPAGTDNSSAHWGFIASTWLYNFSFSWCNGPLSWIIPAEVFDTRTRAKGVAIATATCYAFNTMIGQVTDTAMTTIRWKFYFLFIVCNFTNAIWFWMVLPETAQVPLEEMNYLFEHAPWFIPGINRDDYRPKELQKKVEDQERKRSVVQTESVGPEKETA